MNRSIYGAALIALTSVLLAPAMSWAQQASGTLLTDQLEAFTGLPESAVQEIDDATLAEMSGKKKLVLFDIRLQGELALSGTVTEGSLQIEGHFGDGTENRVPLASGAPPTDGVSYEGVTSSGVEYSGVATVESGAFAGAQGIFTLIQVPGSGNTITSQTQIQLWVLDVNDANLDAVRGAIESRSLAGL